MNATDAPATAPVPHTKGLRLAAILALFGILLTIIHLVWPSPLMFTIFMLFGQTAFGAGMAIYAWIVFRDLKRRKAL